MSDINKIKVKIKKLHPNAKIPEQSYDTDAGYDIFALSDPEVIFSVDYKYNNESDLLKTFKYLSYIEYRTGIAVEPPEGYHFEIYPRSSISEMGFVLANSIGLIDNSYRGEIKLRFKPILTITDRDQIIFTKFYKEGDKIGQLVLKKTNYVEFEEVSELSETPRNKKGFGSTDKKE